MLRLLGLALVALLALASASGWRLPVARTVAAEPAPRSQAAQPSEAGLARPEVDLVLEYVPPPRRSTPYGPEREPAEVVSRVEPAQVVAPRAAASDPSAPAVGGPSAEVERLRRLLAVYERVAR